MALAERTVARASLLSRVDLFTGLDRITLSKLAANLDPVFHEDGVAACVQGEPGDSLHIVSDGTLGVFLVSESGEEQRVATLGVGEAFGEMALLTGEPRTATVRALGDAETLRLERTRFIELLTRKPRIGLAINATLSRRLGAANSTTAAALALLDPEVALSVRAAALAPTRALVPAAEAEAEAPAARRRFSARPTTIVTVLATLTCLGLAAF